MNKKATLAFLLATSAFFIMGCSNNSENNSTKTSNDLTYSKPSYNTLKRPFVLSKSTFTKCPFVIKDNSIIFPNTNDENRISYIDSTFNNNIINTSDVKDFINLSTDDLCISNNTIYFSNISKGNRLSSTNFNSKTEEIISEDNVSNLVAVDNLIYYINNTDSINNGQVNLNNCFSILTVLFSIILDFNIDFPIYYHFSSKQVMN